MAIDTFSFRFWKWLFKEWKSWS